MSDSDEYEHLSENEFPNPTAIDSIKGSAGTRSKRKNKHALANEDGDYAWTADYKRSWDVVQEDASGSITSAVEGIIEAGKRRRLLKDATPVQRGIIRHLVLVLDFAISMTEKDLRPSRHELSINLACDFVTEYFEQNPISQLSVIGMFEGISITVSALSGNPQDHIAALQSRKQQECKGDASLQNALEMARATLFHVPSHGTREILVIFGGLVSSDPGDIFKTITSLVQDHIRVKIIGLAASLAICREIVKRTNSGRLEGYGIILNEYHFKELLMQATTPPAATTKTSDNSLIMIGFPSRVVEAVATLCACHGTLTYGGYNCPRCGSKVCGLPAECPSCSLTLILSTHLARSYHHLFPLVNWEDVSWAQANTENCFACLSPFQKKSLGENTNPQESSTTSNTRRKREKEGGQASESGRYQCPACTQHFCIECDLFAHEVLFECPGCQAGAGRGGNKQKRSSKSVAAPVPQEQPSPVRGHANGRSGQSPSQLNGGRVTNGGGGDV